MKITLAAMWSGMESEPLMWEHTKESREALRSAFYAGAASALHVVAMRASATPIMEELEHEYADVDAG